MQVDKVRMSAKCMKRLKLTSNEIAVKEISKKINGLYTHVVSNVSITSCFLKKKYAKYGGLIVGFQPLMVISPRLQVEFGGVCRCFAKKGVSIMHLHWHY